MFRNTKFVETMTKLETEALLSFKAVDQNFLRNTKSPEYKQIVAKMVKNFQPLGLLINLKLHFLHSYHDKFPDNLGEFSEEQGERFHLNIKVMETRYQRRWDVNMMADFCWMLKRDVQKNYRKRKRNPLNRSFDHKRIRYSSKKETENNLTIC